MVWDVFLCVASHAWRSGVQRWLFLRVQYFPRGKSEPARVTRAARQHFSGGIFNGFEANEQAERLDGHKVNDGRAAGCGLTALTGVDNNF